MQSEAVLDPTRRTLYADIFRPPPGLTLDTAVATTYSLDFETALSVPAIMAFNAAEDREETLKTPLGLLEGLERMANRIAIFCDAGRIHGRPKGVNRLSALLEDTVTEVVAPNGGAFHPKLWALRFVSPNENNSPRMRLAILSRNLTTDASWDLALSLDGECGGEALSTNEPLRKLITALPDMAAGRPTPPSSVEVVKRIADDIARTKWELPSGVDKLSFAVNGLVDSADWMPESGKRLAVISPFLTARALQELTRELDPSRAYLVSRSEELDTIGEQALARFHSVKVLDELAETEDGEEPPDDSVRTSPARGLHAKAFISENADQCTITIGSGNATSAALLGNNNVEVFATLTGPICDLGGVSDQIAPDAFGRYLRDYHAGDRADSAEGKAAECKLDDLQNRLCRADLRLSCSERKNGVALTLSSSKSVDVGALQLHIWPIVQQREDGVVIQALDQHGVGLGTLALKDVTRWLGAVISDPKTGRERLFSMGATLEGLPDRRISEILRSVIENRDAFLSYLRLLLGEETETGRALLAAGAGNEKFSSFGSAGGAGLLEEMVRALSGESRALSDVARLVERLDDAVDEAGNLVIPDEFRQLWTSFQVIMKAEGRSK